MHAEKQRSPLIGWLVIGLLLTQLACRTVMGGVVPVATQTPLPADMPPSPPAVAPDEVGTEQGAQAGKSAPLDPPYRPTTAPGVACIGTFGFGVTCLEDGEWRTYSEAQGDFASDLTQAMAACPDGSVLTVHPSGMGQYSNQEWRSYDKGWGYGSAEAVACGADSHLGNHLWVAHFQGVSHFNGWQWRTYPAAEHLLGMAGDPELLEDIAITTGGDVWAVTANSVAWYRDGEWRVFAEGAGFDDRYFFANVALDAQGRPWVSASAGVFVLEGTTWMAFPNHEFLTPTALAVDAEGRVWVGTLSRGLYILNPDGSWTRYNRENSALSCNNVRAIVVDGQGRVWIGTAWGLNVVADKKWHTYRMDNAELADQDIYTLAVINGGPPLPKPQAKTPGALSGQIVDDAGAALAHVAVELCVEKLYQDAYDSSPCSEQPFFRSTTADGEGRFSFTDLPMGRYVLAVHEGDRWRRISDERGFSSLQVLVTAGENTELGEVGLGEKE